MLLGACSTVRSVRPVGRGNLAVGGSVGGPLVSNFGPPVPLPVGVAFARYGASDRLDIDAGLMLPTVRAAGVDVGASYLLLRARGWRPALMAGGRVALVAGPGTGRAVAGGLRMFEELHLTASFLSGAAIPYLGLSLLGQAEQLRAAPSIVSGVSFNLRPRWQAALEGRWLAAGARPEGQVVRWVPAGGQGAFGVNLGLAYRWGGAP